MVVVVKDAECIEFIRKSPTRNTELVERILCSKLVFEPRKYSSSRRGNEKKGGLETAVPVKIRDERIVRYIQRRKQKFGVLQRRTVELAIKEHKMKEAEQKNE